MYPPDKCYIYNIYLDKHVAQIKASLTKDSKAINYQSVTTRRARINKQKSDRCAAQPSCGGNANLITNHSCHLAGQTPIIAL